MKVSDDGFRYPITTASSDYRATAAAGFARVARFVARVRFHHITKPETNCRKIARLAADIRILLGMPKMSPVWMARFQMISLVPNAVVRELSD